MSTTPQSRKRRQLRRSLSLLENTQSPQPGSPSHDQTLFNRQNCSTPLNTRWRDDSYHLSPGHCSSPVASLSQDYYMKAEVAWQWESPKQSPLAKKKLPKKVVAVREDSPETERRILRSQSMRKSQKPPKEEKKMGFFKFKEELLTLDLKSSTTSSKDSRPEQEVDEKSGSAKVETTADMLKYVLDDSDFSCLNLEKTLVNSKDTPGPSTTKAPLDKDFLFDDSAIDRDLCDLVEENSPETVVNLPKNPLNINMSSQNSQRTSSEEMYFTVEECVKTLTRDIQEESKNDTRKPVSSREDDLKCLIDDSFDEVMSQIPLDGPSNSRNTSFGRHASMPTQKRTESQGERNSSKGIFRYDSMPVNPTRKDEEPLSRNDSSESVSSCSSKCSMKDIELKRKEAMMRLKISRQQKLLIKKNVKKP